MTEGEGESFLLIACQYAWHAEIDKKLSDGNVAVELALIFLSAM